MKIRYTEFALNPALRNTTAHLPAHRAQALIDTGAAVEVPAPPHGAPGWLEYKAEQEAERVAQIPTDRREVINKTPVWRMTFLPLSNKYAVQRLHVSENLTYVEKIILKRGNPDFDASLKEFAAQLKHAGCPEEVIADYKTRSRAPNYLAVQQAQIEEAKRAQAAQEEREKNAIHFI